MANPKPQRRILLQRHRATDEIAQRWYANPKNLPAVVASSTGSFALEEAIARMLNNKTSGRHKALLAAGVVGATGAGYAAGHAYNWWRARKNLQRRAAHAAASGSGMANAG
jgi:hypothetical protein